MADHVINWLSWLNLDPKWLPKLTESLKNIEIEGHLQKMTWDEQIEYLVPTWIEQLTKLDKKVTKLKKTYHADIMNDTKNDLQKLTKLEPNLHEKSAMLPSKKLSYMITILLMSGTPVSIDDIIEIFTFRHKTYFRDNYIKPLESAALITKTNPEKPTASNQKYIITEKGKQFLTT